MKDLTQGSVIKHLLHMSAFLAASMLVQTLYLLADLYWVGHLGKEAIAAVGVAGNLTMIVRISRTAGFKVRQVWYLSVGSLVLQMCVNLLLLRKELRKRLRFGKPEDFIPASATAS